MKDIITLAIFAAVFCVAIFSRTVALTASAILFAALMASPINPKKQK